MSEGLKLPLVLIFIVSFLSIPFIFYVYTNKNTSETGNVQGSTSEIPTELGVTLRVNSQGGAWDLHQFLCDEKEACLKSLTIGKPWGIVSGGVTQNYEFNIAPDQNWGTDFKYLKIFVRSSWGSMSRDFVPSLLHGENLVESTTITSDGVTYDVVLIPLENITDTSAILIEFSDY